MTTKSFIAAAVFAALALPALAQAPAAPQGTRVSVRGTVAKLDGQTLTVKSRDGQMLAIVLAPNYAVRSLVRKKLADIHAGDFVGTTSVPGKDGKLHAVEVHFFPPNLQIPDRQSAWDLEPGSMMTNAHVTGIAKAAHGQVLSVDYKNGTAAFIVDAKTAIVAPAPAPGSAADLKRGKAIYIMANKGADGVLAAASVTVEKNGVKPPM